MNSVQTSGLVRQPETSPRGRPPSSLAPAPAPTDAVRQRRARHALIAGSRLASLVRAVHDAARQLLDAIDAIDESDAEVALLAEIEAAGLMPPGGPNDIGILNNLGDAVNDIAGSRWVVEMLAQLLGNTVAVPVDLTPAAPSLAHPRRTR